MRFIIFHRRLPMNSVKKGESLREWRTLCCDLDKLRKFRICWMEINADVGNVHFGDEEEIVSFVQFSRRRAISK